MMESKDISTFIYFTFDNLYILTKKDRPSSNYCLFLYLSN